MELKKTYLSGLVLYQNVGPRRVTQVDSSASLRNEMDQDLTKWQVTSSIPKLSLVPQEGPDFADVLDFKINQLDMQDIIKANQMALRRG